MSILPKPFNKLSQILGLLMLTSLLSACPSWFQPSTKVIEYDEEVKLHDGSMIWVHIKRHYGRSSGCEISNCFQGYEKGWGAKEVEISWDTGFEGVGRKSVFFDALVTIDKYDDTWYIGGTKNNNVQNMNGSVSCDKYGIFIEGYKCIIAMNKNGFVQLEANNEVLARLRRNIFYPSSVSSSQLSQEDLKGSKLNWETKMSLQVYLLENYADIPLNSSWIN